MRNPVENGVNVAMPLFSAEHFGQLDAFVQYHTPWNVRTKTYLIGTNQQDCPRDRIEPIPIAVQRLEDIGLKLPDMLRNLFHEFAKVIDIDINQLAIGDKLRNDVCRAGFTDMPLVQSLNRTAAGLYTAAIRTGFAHQES